MSQRCKAAVSNSGQEWPISLLTINLSPATLPKAGSHYDLAIVAAILAAQGIFQADGLRRTVLLGELGLDGRVRPVRGVLPATLAAQQAGFTRVIVPMRQAGEAKLVAGIDVFGIASITQLVAFLRDEPMPLVDPIEVLGDPAGKHAKRRLDLADVVGQAEAKWARELRKKITSGVVSPDDARRALVELRQRHRQISAHVRSIQIAYDGAVKTVDDPTAKITERSRPPIHRLSGQSSAAQPQRAFGEDLVSVLPGGSDDRERRRSR